MSNGTAKAQRGRIKGYALVRDSNGKPRIDNIHGIPEGVWDLLTPEEQQEVRENGGYPSHERA